jgi:hypothetical protein
MTAPALDPDCYVFGTEVLLTVTFTDAAGDPVDPPAPEILVRDPLGAESSIGLSNPTVGTFTGSVVGLVAGTWCYRGKSDSVIIGADERQFVILRSCMDTP